MENATKALIIAASILIAIVLIGVGIKILGATKGTVVQTQEVTSAAEVSVFNSQVTQYFGDNVDANTVRELLRFVSVNNRGKVTEAGRYS